MTSVRAVHINELRSRVDALRARFSLGPVNWTNSPIVAGSTTVRAQHLTELRAAVSEIYVAAGLPPQAFGTIQARVTVIQVAHIQQLRAAVDALETAQPGLAGGGR